MPTDLPWGLVPQNDPTTVPRQILESANALPEPRRRAFLWTVAISDALLSQSEYVADALRLPPDGFMMAAGFVPTPTDLAAPKNPGDFFFGACLYPDPSLSTERKFATALVASGQSFQVLIAPSYFVRHKSKSSPPHPCVPPAPIPRGTAACWARPKPGVRSPINLHGDGVLTAAHVGVSLPGAVTGLAPPNPHAVIGYAIDAVVLAPEPIPDDAAQLPIMVAAPGNVFVYLRSAVQPATVLQVFAPSSCVGLLMPHRMVTDTAFAPGDSGALVVDQMNQHATGLYIGETRDVTTNAKVGVCQIMSQVVDQFGLNLFL
jgi:hypothetical protein